MDAVGRRQVKDELFETLTTVGRALSSGRRAELVELLAQGERTVEELAAELGQSVANTSHHLRTLARAGLVATRRSGTHVHYRLASDDVRRLWSTMRRVARSRVAGVDELVTEYLGDGAGIEYLSRSELRSLLDRDEVLVVDVRPAAEYEAGHLPGAFNVPPDALDGLDRLPTGRDVVAYCRGPYCVYANDAVRVLIARGRRAFRLEDGFPEWVEDGGAVERGAADIER